MEFLHAVFCIMILETMPLRLQWRNRNTNLCHLNFKNRNTKMWPFQSLPKHSATKIQRRILLKEKHTVVRMTGFPQKSIWKVCCSKSANNKKSRECHNHKTQPTPDTKRKRQRKKQRMQDKHTNAREAYRPASSLFPKRGDHNAQKDWKKHEEHEAR